MGRIAKACLNYRREPRRAAECGRSADGSGGDVARQGALVAVSASVDRQLEVEIEGFLGTGQDKAADIRSGDGVKIGAKESLEPARAESNPGPRQSRWLRGVAR